MFGLVGAAYFAAATKTNRQLDLKALHVGMTYGQLESAFGSPYDKTRNQLTYILEDSSTLVINLRDNIVANAKIKFHQTIKIEDPDMRRLSLVQMESDQLSSDRPSWFFAGKPEEGLIYKITADGIIESLTWVPPFSYTDHQPKQLQALLQDFQNQNSMNL